MSKTTPCVLATLMLIVMPAAAHAQDDRWQVGTAPSFSSGKYGTDTRTEVLHTPITARRLFESGDVTLVFPFTCIRGNGSVTVVSGSPVRTDRSSTSGTTSDPPTGRTGGVETGGRTGDASEAGRTTGDVSLRPGTTTLTSPVTTCGTGDIVVRGRYYVVDERGWMPTIAVRGHVKAPTASAERGLGTGRPDEGVAIEVSRTIAGGAMAMVDGGYTVIGKPEGVEFNNNWWYAVGIGQDLGKGALNLSAFFEESRSIVPGLANARDVLAAVSLKGAAGWRVQVTGQFGLSDGAPDHGVTFGASRRF